jgi:drug/metabolite transporter (DMT)-like permease
MPAAGILLLMVTSVLWGLNWPAMKFVLREIPPWTFRTLCLMVGGSGLLILGRLGGSRLRIPREELKPLLVVSLLNITGWHLFAAYGVIYSSAGRAAIIGYTAPFWTVVLGRIFLKEKLTSGRIAGLVFGLAGMFFLFLPGYEAIGTNPLGGLFMGCAAFSWALGTIVIKSYRWTLPTALLAGWQMILGGIPVVLGAVLFEPVGAVSGMSWAAVLAMVYIIAFPIIFCHWAWFRMIAQFPASVVSIGTMAVPVVGVLGSALALGEPVGVSEMVSLFLVVVALGLVMIGPDELKRWIHRKS